GGAAGARGGRGAGAAPGGNPRNPRIESPEADCPLVAGGLPLGRGRGGEGARGGGEGIVGELEATEPIRYTLIGERRRRPPRGRDGGRPGTPGRDLLNGEPIPAKSEGELARGDRVRVEAPGGGGVGPPPGG